MAPAMMRTPGESPPAKRQRRGSATAQSQATPREPLSEDAVSVPPAAWDTPLLSPILPWTTSTPTTGNEQREDARTDRRLSSDSSDASSDKQPRKRLSFDSECSSGALAGSEGGSAATSSSSALSTPTRTTTTSNSDLFESFGPPDVVLHVGACAFGVHSDVLRRKCPVLLRKLAALHRTPFAHLDSSALSSNSSSAIVTIDLPSFQLELVELVDVEQFAARRSSSSSSSSFSHPHCPDDDDDGAVSFTAARCLVASSPAAASNDSTLDDALHVVLRHAAPAGVANVLKALYTDDANSSNVVVTPQTAAVTIQLCRWLEFEQALLLESLRVAIDAAIETPTQWLLLLVIVSRLSSTPMTQRRRLATQLLDVFKRYTLAAAVAAIDCAQLSALNDVQLLAQVVTAAVDCTPHKRMWRAVLAQLDRYTQRTFQRRVSLLDWHHAFVAWRPLQTFTRVTLQSAQHVVRPLTLVRWRQCDDVAFALQVRVEPHASVLMRWRIVKETSTHSTPPAAAASASTYEATDPSFTVRGDVVVHFRTARDGPTIEQVVRLAYDHRSVEYGQWQPLVDLTRATRPVSGLELRAARYIDGLPSQSQSESVGLGQTLRDALTGATTTTDYVHATLTGRCFVWGHSICNLYHHLTGCGLFYPKPTLSLYADDTSADSNTSSSSSSSSDGAQYRTRRCIERMQQLPLATLELVLQSDRLRVPGVPGGETALVLLLARLCFGAAAPSLSPASATSDAIEATALDYTDVRVMHTLFRCVRWCFVPLLAITETLKRAPPALELYDVIATGLKDPMLRFPRRMPYYSDKSPYEVQTSLVEFQMEAGDLGLSPNGSRVSSQEESIELGDSREEDAARFRLLGLHDHNDE